MDDVIEDGRDLHASPAGWARLGEAVNRRMKDLDMSQAQLHRLSGLDTRTIRKIRTAGSSSYWKASLETLEDALGWRPGAVRAVLEADELDVDDQAAVDQLVLPDGRNATNRDEQRERDLAVRDRAQSLTRVDHLHQAFDGTSEQEAEELFLEALRVVSERRAAEAERRRR